MSYHRSILSHLHQWKQSGNRKPLIVRGARQVGKTTAIVDFAQSYAYTILLNLEKPSHKSYFTDFDDVKSIMEALLLINRIPADQLPNTLLFVDEIQESPKAIQLLRYFYEELPQLHVIAAGSLLEFALRKVPSFPVGRVEFAYMHPLHFEEYLLAIGHEQAIVQLQQVPVSPSGHKVLLELFHRYLLIGGMPEVVKTDIEKNNLASLPPIYESIWETYKSDVEKYASNETERKIIKHIMATAPFYVDQRIKFQGFGNSNYRSREVGEALRNLDDARIVRLIYPTTDILPPIKSDFKKSPRLQFLDTGLVNYALDIQARSLAAKDWSNTYHGAIVPHMITQEWISCQIMSSNKPNFWVREKKQSQAEVDLVVVHNEYLIPIEVKSGETGSLKSLHQFVDACAHPYAVRIYGGEYRIIRTKTPSGKPYLLLNLPYYLGTQLMRYVAWFIEQNPHPMSDPVASK